jgi:hypothetical protein
MDAARVLDRARGVLLTLTKQPATPADVKVLRSAAARIGAVLASIGGRP